MIDEENEMKFIKLLLIALMLLSCSMAVAKTLFFDDFEDGVISKKWTFTGEWEEKDGHLACVKSKVKFNYALPEISEEYYSKQITIQTKGMITAAPWSRMGVAVRLTPRDVLEAQDGKPTGHLGYALCTPENGPSDVKLLNEGVQWVNLNAPVRPGLNQWVWIQLTVTEEQELLAKVWIDGEEEPNKPTGSVKEWKNNQGQIIKGNRPSGVAGLVGKTMEAWGRGGAIPMYDEVEVWDKDGPSEEKSAVSALDKLTTIWASVKKRMR